MRWPCEETTMDLHVTPVFVKHSHGDYNIRLWITNPDGARELTEHDWYAIVVPECTAESRSLKDIAHGIATRGKEMGLAAVQVRVAGSEVGHMIYTIPFV